MADPERTMLDRADVGPVVAPAEHSHGGSEIGDHADRHATGGEDPVTPESIGALMDEGVTFLAGESLNDLVKGGTYVRVAPNTNTVALGYPVDGWAGFIQVLPSTNPNYVLQKAYSLLTNGGNVYSKNSYFRTKYGDTWGEWIRTDNHGVDDFHSRYTAAPTLLWDNPFLRESYGGWAGSGTWGWAETGGIIFDGAGGYGSKIDVAPGTTVTMNAFVIPHPTIKAEVTLAVQKTQMGSTGFSYEGNYQALTERVTPPPHGVNLTATFTVDTDGFRPRIISGAGHIVSLFITRGRAAPSPFHAPSTLKGSGSPEGAVYAPAGAEYIDLAVTAGAMKWIKRPGALHSGWAVIDGDTGWRDMTSNTVWQESVLDPIWWVRRTGNRVDVSFEFKTSQANDLITEGLLSEIVPYGFRYGGTGPVMRVVIGDGGKSNNVLFLNSSGALGNSLRLDTNPPASNVKWRGMTSWITDDPWPTTLPGTPA